MCLVVLHYTQFHSIFGRGEGQKKRVELDPRGGRGLEAGSRN